MASFWMEVGALKLRVSHASHRRGLTPREAKVAGASSTEGVGEGDLEEDASDDIGIWGSVSGGGWVGILNKASTASCLERISFHSALFPLKPS